MDKIEQYLIEKNIATPEEIDLVVRLMGETEETLNLILYIRTGFRNIKQLEGEE